MICRMKGSLFSRIIWTCPHQFTWPRRDETGGYYQSCVNCGTKYRYDWKSMRRTARLDDEVTGATRRMRHETRVRWRVRERRLRHVVPLHYRVGEGDWLPGESENLSRSGLLFRCGAEIAVGTAMEVKLEMPEELTGEWAPEVLCRGTVARVTPVQGKRKEERMFHVACAIEDYDFGKKAATGTTSASAD